MLHRAARLALVFTAFTAWPSAATPQDPESPRIDPVAFPSVTIDDVFWSPRIRTSREHTIPHALAKCDGRIRNFERAAGLIEGEFEGTYPFDDSDVYKVIEGASYHLALRADPDLDAVLDGLIATIASAQEVDGYLYTARQLDCERLRDWFGDSRYANLARSHELYNAGHLFETAAAHFQATGKRSLLDVAVKFADRIDADFGPDARHDPPGHPEIEIGLASLYRVTGERRYLELARYLIEQRGRTDGRRSYGEYAQDHTPVLDQEHAVGHAVRAAYLYTGMADVADLLGDARFGTAIDRLWTDVVGTKLYVTGGIGATGSGEAFGAAYELPNASAYCETCAGIANVNWNHRMFLRHGDARYVDVLERALYNNVLAGSALDGEHFFYPNVLASHGTHERSEWFGCACCPSNLARFVPSVGRFVAARRGDHDIYVNLYVGGVVRTELGATPIELAVRTLYPWEGDVTIRVTTSQPHFFALRMRIPGWAGSAAVPSDLYRFEGGPTPAFRLSVDDEEVPLRVERGYAVVDRRWRGTETVRLRLPMPVRRLRAHDAVADCRGRVALQRGPLVYCVEGVDVPGAAGYVHALLLGSRALLETEWIPDLLGGVVTLRGTAQLARRENDQKTLGDTVPFRAIPYHVWAHRGRTHMAVWLASELEAAQPAPDPTLAHRSRVSASHNGRLATALADQMEVTTSGDKSKPFFHWWPRKGSVEWVQYKFPERSRVTGCEVFWMFDVPRGECDPPASWRVLFRGRDGSWTPVETDSTWPVSRDAWDRVAWEPVETDAIRLEVTLQDGLSTGLHEWRLIDDR